MTDDRMRTDAERYIFVFFSHAALLLISSLSPLHDKSSSKTRLVTRPKFKKTNTQRKQEFTDGSCDALSCSAIEFPPYQGSSDEEIGGGRVGGQDGIRECWVEGGVGCPHPAAHTHWECKQQR